MSGQTQGWYYSFLSFAALSTLFDLGLSLALVQTAAHLAVSSRWTSAGRLVGEGGQQVRALVAFACRHYVRLAFGFAVLVIPAGLIFFNSSTGQPAGWRAQWVGLGGVTALSLLPLPFLAILEGCGEVAQVAAVRLVQAIVGSLATWSILLVGAGLWATLAVPLASFGIGLLAVAVFWPDLLGSLRHKVHVFDWQKEVWPLQWRLGLSWLSGYLLTQIQTLILFSTTDAVAAGQMGLSLTIGNMLALIAQSVIARHVPAMAQAVAQRDWATLDRLFRRDFLVFCGLFVSGAACCVVFVTVFLPAYYASRVLPPALFIGLLFSLFLGQVQAALAAQLRSYRREPLVWGSMLGAVLTVAFAWPAVQMMGVTGAVGVMLGVQVFLILPYSVFVFWRNNRVWRA
jgi:O-antigen/teichoic acid export membrane protein